MPGLTGPSARSTVSNKWQGGGTRHYAGGLPNHIDAGEGSRAGAPLVDDLALRIDLDDAPAGIVVDQNASVRQEREAGNPAHLDRRVGAPDAAHDFARAVDLD